MTSNLRSKKHFCCILRVAPAWESNPQPVQTPSCVTTACEGGRRSDIKAASPARGVLGFWDIHQMMKHCCS